MRYFAFLFSIYILCLVSAPCVDDTLHLSNGVPGESSGQVPISHSDHTDACSPFCVCSCCNVMVTISPDITISQPFFSVQRSFIAEPSSFISSFSHTFWQPPKIG